MPAPKKKSSLPTRKWAARTVVALGGLATTWASTGGWETEETLMAITIAVAAVTSYLVPNGDENPGGVPMR